MVHFITSATNLPQVGYPNRSWVEYKYDRLRDDTPRYRHTQSPMSTSRSRLKDGCRFGRVQVIDADVGTSPFLATAAVIVSTFIVDSL